jgi:biotin carboxyl carrier protein
MYVHAPASGIALSLLTGPKTVERGTPLFVFEQAKSEAEAELVQTEVALDIFNAAIERLHALAPLQSAAHTTRVQAAQAMTAEYQQVLEVYKLKYENGVASPYLVPQMRFFVAGTDLISANELLAQTQTQHNRDDIAVAIPGIQRCLETARIEAQRHRDRMTVAAHTDGKFTPSFSGRRWVARGVIVGSFDVPAGRSPRHFIEAVMPGYIHTIDVASGEHVTPPAIIATLETGVFELQAAQIDLADLMLLRTVQRCHPDDVKHRLAAQFAHGRAMLEQVRYTNKAVQSMQREVDMGTSTPSELSLARGSLQKAVLDNAQVKVDKLALTLSIDGLRRTATAYRRIVDLQRKLTEARRQQAVIHSQHEGRVTWYVSPGSFISPGAKIASIS